MKIGVVKANYWNIPGFEDFYRSLYAACASFPASGQLAATNILTLNEETIRYACAGLIFLGLEEYIRPIEIYNDLFTNIVRKIFDEDGNPYLDDKNNEIRWNSGAAMLSVCKTLEVLSNPDGVIDICILHQEGVTLGIISSNLSLHMHGLGILLEQMGPAVETARQITTIRSEGGKRRAEQMREAATLWKKEALPVALRFARSHPGWTRTKMAAEIVQHFDWETPGSRQVENWLKDEAEAPRGPLPSRARRNSEHR